VFSPVSLRRRPACTDAAATPVALSSSGRRSSGRFCSMLDAFVSGWAGAAILWRRRRKGCEVDESNLSGLSDSPASTVDELLRVMWPWEGAARAWAEQFAADEAEFAALEGVVRGDCEFSVDHESALLAVN
jgi:hypothetical protein